ncbi:hypothetical protein Q8A67_023028 [Cirrhinus molitorella]|uniref:Uncharacterized protein n=1 Tax=Cirrhinus molitorella TaxID=172907 RepID=A0AA88P8Z0_9TELE|nr:hypothetical protein Q8A67_023028 [Cirrhinus molitorella]
MELAKLFILILLCHRGVCNGLNHKARSIEEERLEDLLSWDEASDVLLKGLLGEDLQNGGLVSQETNSSTGMSADEYGSDVPANFSLDADAVEFNSNPPANVNVPANFSLDADAEAEEPSSSFPHETEIPLVILPGNPTQGSESVEESADTSTESKPSLLIVYGNFSDIDNLEISVNGSDTFDVGLP